VDAALVAKCADHRARHHAERPDSEVDRAKPRVGRSRQLMAVEIVLPAGAPTARAPDATPAPPRIEMRQVGKHALIYGLGIVLSRAVSFIMLPIYTRYLSPTDYGVMELISMTLDVISMIAGAQIAVGIFRYYHKAQELAEKNAVVSTALWALTVSYGLVGVVSFLAAGPLSSLIFRSAEHAHLIRIAAVGFAFQGLMIVPLTYARARDRSTLFVVANAIKLAIGLASNLLLVVHFQMGVKGVLISNLVASGIVGGGLTLLAVRDVGLRFSRDATRDLLRYGVPMIGTWMAAFISTYADRYFLQATGDTAAVGLYSLAYTFGFILMVLGQVPFMQVWESKRFEIAKLDNRDAYLAKGFVYLNLLLISVAVGIALFVGDLLRIMAAPAFFSAARIVPLILIAYVFQAWTNAVEIGILVRERTGLLSLANWIAAAVALALYAVLIPRWLGMGAATATVVAFAVRLAVVYWMSQRLWPVRYQFRPVLKLTTLALVICLLGASLPSGDQIASIGGHALLGLIYLVAVWRIGVLSSAERARLLETVRLASASIQARVLGGAAVPR
jgi:O-antigen/teichoic acid export membrane protein